MASYLAQVAIGDYRVAELVQVPTASRSRNVFDEAIAARRGASEHFERGPPR